MKLYNYSDGLNSGFFRDGNALQEGRLKGPIRPGKHLIDEETEIPTGWQRCPNDETAIEPIPTMKSLIRSL